MTQAVRTRLSTTPPASGSGSIEKLLDMLNRLLREICRYPSVAVYSLSSEVAGEARELAVDHGPKLKIRLGVE